MVRTVTALQPWMLKIKVWYYTQNYFDHVYGSLQSIFPIHWWGMSTGRRSYSEMHLLPGGWWSVDWEPTGLRGKWKLLRRIKKTSPTIYLLLFLARAFFPLSTVQLFAPCNSLNYWCFKWCLNRSLPSIILYLVNNWSSLGHSLVSNCSRKPSLPPIWGPLCSSVFSEQSTHLIVTLVQVSWLDYKLGKGKDQVCFAFYIPIISIVLSMYLVCTCWVS